MLTIHRAQIEDILGIKDVLTATWIDTYSSLLSNSSIARVTAEWHSARVLESELNRPSTFLGIAKSGSTQIVGIITAHSLGELLVIARLYVLPKYQRKGIGGRLVEESLRAFPQTRRVQLDVEQGNPKGRAFYRKIGFREVRVKIEDIAGTKLNTIVLEKHIQNAD